MKRTYLWIFTFIACVAMLSSCNDEWKDELYVQRVTLKAPVNTNGVYNVYLRYNDISQEGQEAGVDTFYLPVTITGTTYNQRDIHIKLGIDNDTIADLNVARFSWREDLYYRQLPEQHYRFIDQDCHIKKGQSEAVFPIEFNIAGLDLVHKWVLPVTVMPDDSYEMETYKGRNKALLNINLYNDYSGSYSATNMNVFIKGTSQPDNVSTRRCYVVDESTVFFYAGTTWEELEERDIYKVMVHFNEPTTIDEEGNAKGTVELSAGDPENRMNLQTFGECTYEIQRQMDPKKFYLLHYYVTLRLKYSYSDVTSDPKNPISFIVAGDQDGNSVGTMTLERQIDTRIPDEDQAIQW
ncbi:MAG: DUF4973 domain-containing protein [Prevotella sp.]